MIENALVRTCARCLYTTAHPLGLTLDSGYICSGCRVHEEKDVLDFRARWDRLVEIVEPYRARTGGAYDCIVPVSGANDSYWIVDIVKNKLKLNPLLVTYNKYFNTSIGIRNLAQLRIKFNCDILYQNVNPISVKKITRSTLRAFGSIYWPCLAGQTVFPVQTAVRFGIPLIIWGAHQGLEQVGMFSHLHEVEMTRRYRKDHDLMGMEADDLLSVFNTLTEEDVWQYRYPDDFDLNRVGVRGIYLGNFVRWDPKAQHEEMAISYGYRGASSPRTFDTYDHVDCYNYLDVHDWLKFVKHGYSKVTDQACREIRHGRLRRDEAAALVRKYEAVEPRYLGLFCDWLGMTENSFRFVADQHRSKRVWQQLEPTRWVRRQGTAGAGHTEIGSSESLLGFAGGGLIDDPADSGYITFGKGFPSSSECP